jgi:hypothetical protein
VSTSLFALVACAPQQPPTITPPVPQTTVATPPPANTHATSVVFTVFDRRDRPIGMATVRIRNAASGQIQAFTETSAIGQGTFQNIPPGRYVLELMKGKETVVAVGQPFSIAEGDTIASFVKQR